MFLFIKMIKFCFILFIKMKLSNYYYHCLSTIHNAFVNELLVIYEHRYKENSNVKNNEQ